MIQRESDQEEKSSMEYSEEAMWKINFWKICDTSESIFEYCNGNGEHTRVTLIEGASFLPTFTYIKCSSLQF